MERPPSSQKRLGSPIPWPALRSLSQEPSLWKPGGGSSIMTWGWICLKIHRFLDFHKGLLFSWMIKTQVNTHRLWCPFLLNDSTHTGTCKGHRTLPLWGASRCWHDSDESALPRGSPVAEKLSSPFQVMVNCEQFYGHCGISDRLVDAKQNPIWYCFIMLHPHSYDGWDYFIPVYCA